MEAFGTDLPFFGIRLGFGKTRFAGRLFWNKIFLSGQWFLALIGQWRKHVFGLEVGFFLLKQLFCD
jgi:hypothetical protein